MGAVMKRGLGNTAIVESLTTETDAEDECCMRKAGYREAQHNFGKMHAHKHNNTHIHRMIHLYHGKTWKP